MSNHTEFVDKHGRNEIFPGSDSTIYRLSNRLDDPFPAGQLIGGKRYWRVADILEWLDRQDKKLAPVDMDCKAAGDEPDAQAHDSPRPEEPGTHSRRAKRRQLRAGGQRAGQSPPGQEAAAP